MTWIEVGALLVIALAVADGAYGGLAWALLELLLLAVTALLAGALTPHVEGPMIKIVDVAPPHLAWVTHATVFALVAIPLFGALFLVHPSTKRWRFPRDGWFGAAAGVLTGLLVVLLATAYATWASPRPYEEVLATSLVVELLDALADPLAALFPPELAGRLAGLSGMHGA